MVPRFFGDTGFQFSQPTPQYAQSFGQAFLPQYGSQLQSVLHQDRWKFGEHQQTLPRQHCEGDQKALSRKQLTALEKRVRTLQRKSQEEEALSTDLRRKFNKHSSYALDAADWQRKAEHFAQLFDFEQAEGTQRVTHRVAASPTGQQRDRYWEKAGQPNSFSSTRPISDEPLGQTTVRRQPENDKPLKERSKAPSKGHTKVKVPADLAEEVKTLIESKQNSKTQPQSKPKEPTKEDQHSDLQLPWFLLSLASSTSDIPRISSQDQDAQEVQD
ncbi:TPA: hypothetical protein ACH3X2_001949 [Trebouxia sp. C0005]